MSDLLPGTHNWPSAVAGTWFPGIPLVTMTRAAGGAALARVQISIHAPGEDLELDSESAGEVTITDAAAWSYRVEGFACTLPGGKYTVRVKTTDADGHARRYLAGEWTLES